MRTAMSLVFIALVLWFAFTVKLGTKTLAQHIDAIGATREAQDLFDGARETVNPALEEARDRIVGEHVEAPTYIEGERPPGTAEVDATSGSPGQPRVRRPAPPRPSPGSRP
ncbi:MAG: hypothetical protein B7733_25455 [Myxococcales bacterium FL481]|nr:MAG: hypothetical protein B7733_25455 [Myxococcales bacterium FL481]